jgi:phospholipid/cholesterol/gamma-HCH transport system substrate-binding protein
LAKSAEKREVVYGGLAVLFFMAVFGVFYSGQHQKATAGLTEYTIYATFNRIDGLDVGTEVRLSGIPIGTVEELTLTSNFRARVTMRLHQGVELPADTSAAIHTDGLFGSKFVTLDPGGDEVALKNGDTITFTQDAVVVSDLLDLIIAEGKSRRAEAVTPNGETGDNSATGDN